MVAPFRTSGTSIGVAQKTLRVKCAAAAARCKVRESWKLVDETTLISLLRTGNASDLSQRHWR